MIRPPKQYSGLCFALLFGLTLALFAPQAQAQTPPSQAHTAFQLQQFRPSLDPNGMFQSLSAASLGQWAFQIGAMFHYSWSPLFLVSPSSKQQVDVVNHQLGLDLAFGVGLLSFLDVVVNMPITLYQAGQLPQLDILGQAAGRPLSGTYPGDLTVRARLQTLQSQIHGVNLGFLVQLGVPSGDELTFNGEDGISFSIGALLSRDFGRFGFALNFGYRYLPETNFLGLIIGHELFYNLGVNVAVMPKFFDIIAEINGTIGLSGGLERVSSPMGLLAGIRFFPMGSRLLALQLGVGIGILKGYGSPGFRGFFGLVWHPSASQHTQDSNQKQDSDGDGIPDRQDRCIRQPGPQSNAGCPPVRTPVKQPPRPRVFSGDRDGDGLSDPQDRCPTVAGPKSNHGCPLPDSDGDGVPDRQDRCPRQAGPKSNHGCPLGVRTRPAPRRLFPDRDRDRDGDGIPDRLDRCPGLPGSKRRRGCPKHRLTKLNVRRRRIYLRTRVRFYRGRLRRKTRQMMQQVARLMKSFPTMKIRITATTYSRSRRRWVLRRSWIRARALRRYLQRLGISKKRISIRGKRRYRRRRSTRTYYRIDILRF